MKKKILITGSQGYIAKNIAKKLQNKNIIVHGIGRGEWKKKDYFEWGYKNQINGNINLKNLSKFNTKFDYIIHCAGSGTVGLSNNIDFKNNVESTKLLLEYVKKNQDNVKIIFLSSYSVYGNNYKKPISERTKPNPKSRYAINKKKAEDICVKFSKKFNFDLMILRIASLYGNGLRKQLLYDACLKFTKGVNVFYGTGKEKRDFIHITDLVNIIANFCLKGFSNINIINCGSGKGRKINAVLKLISKNLNKKIEISFDKKKLNTNPTTLISNIKKLKKLRIYPKKKFEIGIKEYVNWYKKNI